MDTAALATELRSMVSALHKGLRKQMYSVNAYSMTEIETIAHLIRESSLLPSELAALTKVKPQSMTQILNKLEKQGVIVKTPSEADKRKVYISLTPFGKEIVEKTRYHRDEWLKAGIEKSLTKNEQELLAKALHILRKLIENR